MQAGARPAESSRAPNSGARSWQARQAGLYPGGHWRVERRLKTGAVFEIWKANGRDGSSAAVKAPNARYRDEPLARRALRAEFAWLAGLQHANIVSGLALIDTPHCLALATEYLGGGDFASLAGAPPRFWLAPLRELMGGLAYLHERGIVHRDIKARNVMLHHDGGVRLIDFASAERCGAAVAPGGITAAHRPAFAQRRVSAAEDVYALAVLVYELFTGRLPFGLRGARLGSPAPAAPAHSRVPAVNALADLTMTCLVSPQATVAQNTLAFAEVLRSIDGEDLSAK